LTGAVEDEEEFSTIQSLVCPYSNRIKKTKTKKVTLHFSFPNL
jgi:hypothetical protein